MHSIADYGYPTERGLYEIQYHPSEQLQIVYIADNRMYPATRPQLPVDMKLALVPQDRWRKLPPEQQKWENY